MEWKSLQVWFHQATPQGASLLGPFFGPNLTLLSHNLGIGQVAHYVISVEIRIRYIVNRSIYRFCLEFLRDYVHVSYRSRDHIYICICKDIGTCIRQIWLNIWHNIWYNMWKYVIYDITIYIYLTYYITYDIAHDIYSYTQLSKWVQLPPCWVPMLLLGPWLFPASPGSSAVGMPATRHGTRRRPHGDVHENICILYILCIYIYIIFNII